MKTVKQKILLAAAVIIGLASFANTAQAADKTADRPQDSLGKYRKHKLVPGEKRNQCEIKHNQNGSFTLLTKGKDPWFSIDNINDFYKKDVPYVLAMQYSVDKNPGKLAVYYKDSSQKKANNIGKIFSKASKPTWLLLDLSKNGGGLGVDLDWLRIDVATMPDVTLKVHKLYLIEADKNLILRSIIGSLADKVESLGIKPGKLVPDSCGMETVRHADKESLSIVRSVFAHLDLDARTKQMMKKNHVKALVPLGPVIAAGEGEHPENHTVVRILSRHQLREIQFLAFPPSVKGGVGISALKLGKNSYGFACHPLNDTKVKTVKIFNRYGGQVASARPSGLMPPFTVAGGEFLAANSGEELAVTSRYEPGPVHIFSATGKLLKKIESPASKKSEEGFHLAVIGATRNNRSGKLVYQDIREAKLYSFNGTAGFGFSADLKKLPKGTRVFESVFPQKKLNAVHNQKVISTLYSMDKKGAVQKFDAGRRENTFYYKVNKGHGGSKEPWPDEPDTGYVKKILMDPMFQAQDWSVLTKTGDIKNKSRKEWLAGLDWNERNFLAKHLRRMGGPLNEYTKRTQPSAWGANFTHRLRLKNQQAMISRIGEKGLPEYLCLDRKNEKLGGGYFGMDMFRYGSYNFEQPELHDFYHLVHWEFYRQLAAQYRKKPSGTVAVKPSHENEVQSGEGSLGDYNLQNIKGFYRYLLALYGSLDTINKTFGTPYTEKFFDAPRGFQRGAWDNYSDKNPLFRDWIEYNRINVYRRVGESLLGCILAGFPPQLLRIHQIPGPYISDTTVGIMDNAKRITPVDWFLTSGTGFGYTRYGLWYENERNMAQGAWSSGFSDWFNGEYTSKTGDPEKAWGQLKYAVDHGMKGALVMAWPDPKKVGLNTTMISAMSRLHKEYADKPIPGLAGGISAVRAYANTSGSYDIAALGCTENNTGLLKSLNADGSFEGTVYVVPFHNRVEVVPLLQKEKYTVTAKPAKLCTLKKVRQGCVIEICFTVSAGSKADSLEVLLYRGNRKLPGQTTVLGSAGSGKKVRVVYKFPVIMDNVSFALVSRKGAAVLENLRVHRHQDLAVNSASGIWEGKRHQGGISFDVLGR